MDFGKRTSLVHTRNGFVPETYWVCYSCPDRLTEEETQTHKCKE